VTDIVSVSAVGSLRESLAPGTFVIVDQFIDRTYAREKSFFAAVWSRMSRWRTGMPPPRRPLARGGAADRHPGGARHLSGDGRPQFSSLAESELYRSWNCDVIGMTTCRKPSSRERPRFATPPSRWSPTTTAGTQPRRRHLDAIVKVLLANADKARALVKAVAPLVQADGRGTASLAKIAAAAAPCNTPSSRPEARDAKMVEKLSAVAGRVLK